MLCKYTFQAEKMNQVLLLYDLRPISLPTRFRVLTQQPQRCLPSGALRFVVCWMPTDISEVKTAFIIRDGGRKLLRNVGQYRHNIPTDKRLETENAMQALSSPTSLILRFLYTR